MGDPSNDLKRQYAFFHALSKTLTEESQFPFNSGYKAGHVNFSNDILTDVIPYLPDSMSADAYVSGNPDKMVKYVQYDLTELIGSNGQTWYIEDAGEWIRPIMLPSLAPDPITNEPSNGLIAFLYESDNTFIPPTDGVWFIDPFQGIVKFEEGFTPSDMGWGNPKITCYAYVGGTLSDSISGGTVAVSLQDAYDVGNTIIHDGANDIQLFGSGGTGAYVDTAGDVYIQNEMFVEEQITIEGGLRDTLMDGDSIHVSNGGSADVTDPGVHIFGPNVDGAGTVGGTVMSQGSVSDRRLYHSGNDGGFYWKIGAFSTSHGELQISNSQAGVAGQFRIAPVDERAVRNNNATGLIAAVQTQPSVTKATDTDADTAYLVTANGGALSVASGTDGGDLVIALGDGQGTGSKGKLIVQDEINAVDLCLSSLNPTLSGNFITWNADGCLVDAGINVSTIAAAISGVTLQFSYEQGNTITLNSSAGEFSVLNDSGQGLIVNLDGSVNITSEAIFDDDVTIDGDLLVPIIGAPDDPVDELYVDELIVGEMINNTHVVDGRSIYLSNVENFPTSGSNRFVDFEVVPDQRGNLRFDRIDYVNPTSRTQRNYTNLLTLLGDTYITAPGLLDLDNMLGPYGRRLIDQDHYRDFVLNSPSFGGEDVDYLFQSNTWGGVQGFWNAGVANSDNRGIGMYMTGSGKQADIRMNVYVPDSGVFSFSCDVLGAWHRRIDQPRWSGYYFAMDNNNALGTPFATVTNADVQALTWYDTTTANPSSNQVTVNHTWTGLAPGEHTLWIKFASNGSQQYPTPPGFAASQQQNVNIAIFNFFSNSEYPESLHQDFVGISSPNVVIDSLTPANSGNLLSFDADRRIIDTGVSVAGITGAAVNKVDRTGDTMTGDLVMQSSSIQVTGGEVRINDASLSKVTTTNVITNTIIDSVGVNEGNCCFWDLCVTDGTNYRASRLMVVWDGTDIRINEAATDSIGDTSGVIMQVMYNGGNTEIQLKASIVSGTWTVSSFKKVI